MPRLTCGKSQVTVLGFAATMLALAAPGAVVAQGFDQADTQLRFDGASVSPSAATARAGFTSAPSPGGGIEPIFVYRLPVIAAGTTITSAVLSINLASITVPGSINYNVDLYALPYRAASTVLATDFFVGALDPSPTATLIEDNFVLQSNAAVGRYLTDTASSQRMAAFLNAQYLAGAVGGPTGSFVFFRLSPDRTVGNGFGGYDLSTQDNASTSGLRPTLTLTTASTAAAPEPGAACLLAFGLLPLARFAHRRRANR